MMKPKLPKHYYIILWSSLCLFLPTAFCIYYEIINPLFIIVLTIFTLPILILFFTTKKYEIDESGNLNVFHLSGLKLKSINVKDIKWVYNYQHEVVFLTLDKSISIYDYYLKHDDALLMIELLAKDKVYREDMEEMRESRKEFIFLLSTFSFFFLFLIFGLIGSFLNGTFDVPMLFLLLFPFGIVMWIVPKMKGQGKILREINKQIGLNNQIYK